MRGTPVAVMLLALAASAAASPTGPDSSYSLPPAGSAVLVRLDNGQELSGVLLRREDGATWIGVDQGEVGVETGEIADVARQGSVTAEFRARERLLAPGDAAGAWALAAWARGRGLDASARAAARRAVAAEPDHAAARAFLGEEKVGGRWLEHDAAMEARGWVEDGGEWVTRKEKAAREETRRKAAAAAEAERREASLRASVDLLLRLEAARAARLPEPPTYVVTGFLARPARPFPAARKIPGESRAGLFTGPFSPLFGRNYFERRVDR